MWKKQHKQRAKGMEINDPFGEGREVGVVRVDRYHAKIQGEVGLSKEAGPDPENS